MRIVLAYSGGLHVSVAIPWLAETYRAEIVTVTLDLGGGADLGAIRDRALSLGATRAHVLDLREAFARDYFARALGSDATLEDGSPLLAALSQLAIGHTLVDTAKLEGADAVAHGSVDGNLTRIERVIATLAPTMRILAPVRDRLSSDAEAVSRLLALGLQARALQVSRVGRAGQCPGEPAVIEVTFEKGQPTAVNGIPMPLVELVENVGMIAAAHGVCRYEPEWMAGAFVLHAAHRELRNRATPAAANDFLRLVSKRYVEIVQGGEWFTPLREALDAGVEKIDEQLNGTVYLQLFEGKCQTVDNTARRRTSETTAALARG
jgi:argininosuccinate synthase